MVVSRRSIALVEREHTRAAEPPGARAIEGHPMITAQAGDHLGQLHVGSAACSPPPAFAGLVCDDRLIGAPPMTVRVAYPTMEDRP